MTTARELILTERLRQITDEGYSVTGDVGHWRGLWHAARCYQASTGDPAQLPPDGWPWNQKAWKPRGRQRDLARAGALALAASVVCPVEQIAACQDLAAEIELELEAELPTELLPIPPSCVCHPPGILVDQTYGNIEVPPDAVPVQACDACQVYASDVEAAQALADLWGTTIGGLDPATGQILADEDDEPGDVWVVQPIQAVHAETCDLDEDCSCHVSHPHEGPDPDCAFEVFMPGAFSNLPGDFPLRLGEGGPIIGTVHVEEIGAPVLIDFDDDPDLDGIDPYSGKLI